MRYDQQKRIYLAAIEKALAEYLAACGAPEPLKEAMGYSLMAGGKRLRPMLLLAACDMGDGELEMALPFACALEMIHTYSLIHDDLPAMDDDDLRRGKPTSHKVFGEGMAILAGDGLLSLAFEVMLGTPYAKGHVLAARRIAKAAGVGGMVAGQALDIRCEKEQGGTEESLHYIHLHKTADLFIGAVCAGLSIAGATPQKQAAGEVFARALGLAFQIRDDLLDIEGNAIALGKGTGKDGQRGKLTWPGLMGEEAAHQALEEQTAIALSALSSFGAKAAFLSEMAERLLVRES